MARSGVVDGFRDKTGQDGTGEGGYCGKSRDQRRPAGMTPVVA